MVDRADESRKTITKTLAEGTTIVCDRYVHSGIVYSAAKGNPLLPLSWAASPEKGLPRPDAVVFLDLTPEEAAKRGGWGDEVYEKAEMQSRVRALFRGLAGLEEAEGLQKDEDITVVDAGGSVESVAEDIWTVVGKAIGDVQGEVRRI